MWQMCMHTYAILREGVGDGVGLEVGLGVAADCSMWPCAHAYVKAFARTCVCCTCGCRHASACVHVRVRAYMRAGMCAQQRAGGQVGGCAKAGRATRRTGHAGRQARRGLPSYLPACLHGRLPAHKHARTPTTPVCTPASPHPWRITPPTRPPTTPHTPVSLVSYVGMYVRPDM